MHNFFDTPVVFLLTQPHPVTVEPENTDKYILQFIALQEMNRNLDNSIFLLTMLHELGLCLKA